MGSHKQMSHKQITATSILLTSKENCKQITSQAMVTTSICPTSIWPQGKGTSACTTSKCKTSKFPVTRNILRKYARRRRRSRLLQSLGWRWQNSCSLWWRPRQFSDVWPPRQDNPSLWCRLFLRASGNVARPESSRQTPGNPAEKYCCHFKLSGQS